MVGAGFVGTYLAAAEELKRMPYSSKTKIYQSVLRAALHVKNVPLLPVREMSAFVPV